MCAVADLPYIQLTEHRFGQKPHVDMFRHFLLLSVSVVWISSTEKQLQLIEFKGHLNVHIV